MLGGGVINQLTVVTQFRLVITKIVSNSRHKGVNKRKWNDWRCL